MVGKRKHGDGTSVDVTPKRRKKNRPAEDDPGLKKLPAMAMAKEERVEAAAPAGMREVVGEAGGEFGEGKGKKSGKKRREGKEGVDSLDSRPMSDAEPEPHRKKKKKKKKEKQEEDAPLPPRLEHLQSVEDNGLVSSAEPERKKEKKKKKKEGIPEASTSVTLQIVEDDGLLSGAEPQRKKKKKTKKEVAPTPVTLDSSQVVEDGQGKKKKKKTKKEAAPTPVTLDSSQIVEDGLGSGAEPHGKKKKKKRKFATTLPSSDPSKAVEDRGPVTGSVKKTILKSQKPQAGNGAESDRKKKKKVTFQLPDRVEDEPSEKELLGEETEFTDRESSTWKTDKLRPGLVYGMYTPEEDGVLKQAIFDYIQEQGWDREEGLEKILNSRRSEARGCWHVIRKCLPQRELKRIYARAHRILGPNTLLGKWTNEEMQSLIELHSVHGNDWKRIATVIGRDPEACKDKWRYLKWSNSKDYKIGAWSEEEHQKLCKLVFKCLHVKAQMAKKGLITKNNRLIRDDINWEFIAEQMGGRGRLDCLCQWYRKMASPMVTTGEWSNGDDQRLLERLMEEFPLSEELVEWDSLLDNRSGETCKKRWEQMQRTLGRGPEVRHQHFLEKLESVMKRFAPHLLDTEYDQKFAEDMQRADADELEDVDM